MMTGRLPIDLNYIPLLENNVVLPLHYAKVMKSSHNKRFHVRVLFVAITFKSVTYVTCICMIVVIHNTPKNSEYFSIISVFK